MTAEPRAPLDRGFVALANGQWSSAARLFHKALADGDIAEALMGLATASYWLGDLDSMIGSLERAYAAAFRRADPGLAIGAALLLVGYQKVFLGNTVAARGWLSRARRLVEERAPEYAGELLGATSFVTDDPAESERLAREAVAIGRAKGSPDLELGAMTAVGAALVQQGRLDEGMALLDEAMAGAIGGECSDPLSVAHIGCMTMLVCASYWDIERATHWLVALERFIEEHGCPFLLGECRTHYGRVLFENGSWTRAEELLSASMSMTGGLTPSARARATATLAELRLAQGLIEEAGRLLEGVRGRDEAVVAVVSLDLVQGRPSVAAAVARRLLVAVGSDRLDVAPVIELLGRAELASGERVAAGERGRGLVKLGAAHDCKPILAYGKRLVAAVTAAVDAAAACRQFEESAAAFGDAGLPYRAAQTRHELATVARELDRGLAEAEARAALTAFEDLGARRDADAAAAFLRSLGVSPARRGPKNIGRLTKREQEVLQLIADGQSNPEIAERLFISRKTVEHHVERVLAKLGLRSRTEAAALVARAG